MGIKLQEALHNGAKIKIEEANESMKEDLKCVYCGVKLTYVNGYYKEINDKKCYVKPYFRLKSKENDHQNCKYDTVGQLKVVAKESSDDVLSDIEEGKFELRLHLISDSIDRLQNSSSDNKDDSTSNGNYKEKEFIKSGEKLESYFSTMKRLLQLRSVLESNSDMSSKVILKFRDRKGNVSNISWNNFYYDIDSFINLYGYIERKRPYHPIAIFGIVKKIIEPNEKYKFYTIELESPRAKKVGSEYQIPSIQIKVENRRLDSLVEHLVGKEILLYSKFWISGKRKWEKKLEDNKKVEYYFLNIKGNLLHRNQIITL
ncbi:hypothetical protein [Clostridium hydrogeniformans]|uniref:hypothetical protein n=1 Tax=Clostridium hydrogeniformans TaxID=349933 RepID=UPI000485504B|nr:hypothetical protein [Clostridium hydrogeniformans]